MPQHQSHNLFQNTQICNLLIKETPIKTDNRAWLTVLGGICTLIIVGNEYLWGNINSYVISYFHHKGDPNALS